MSSSGNCGNGRKKFSCPFDEFKWRENRRWVSLKAGTETRRVAQARNNSVKWLLISCDILTSTVDDNKRELVSTYGSTSAVKWCPGITSHMFVKISLWTGSDLRELLGVRKYCTESATMWLSFRTKHDFKEKVLETYLRFICNLRDTSLSNTSEQVATYF